MKTSSLYKEVAGIETSLKPGVPLSQQLREERKIIEKTAIGFQKSKGEGLGSAPHRDSAQYHDKATGRPVSAPRVEGLGGLSRTL
jgi:hypothetical protein